jgi:hypothetical protein
MIGESSHRKVTTGSNTAFGLTFGFVFLIVSVWPVFYGNGPRLWALAVAALFFLIALIKPQLLAVLNRLWLKFGLVLSSVMNPIVMAIIYFGVIVPIGLLRRALRHDPLRLRKRRDQPTYWIPRDPPGPAPGSMSKQF